MLVYAYPYATSYLNTLLDCAAFMQKVYKYAREPATVKLQFSTYVS